MSVRDTILEQVQLVARQQKRTLAPLHDDLRLAESGLDSLCLAILVSNLDDELGLDPFNDARGLEMPVTLGEFIHLYENDAG